MNAAVLVLAIVLCFIVVLMFVVAVFPLAQIMNPVIILYSMLGFGIGFFTLVILLLAMYRRD